MYPQVKLSGEGVGKTLPARPLAHWFRRLFVPSAAIVATVAAGISLHHRLTTSAAVTPHPAVPQQTDRIDLTVGHNGEALAVRWPVSTTADHGLLTITDGNHKTRMELDGDDIRSGLLTYWPDSQTVTFRLELISGSRTLEGQASSTVPAAAPDPAAGAGRVSAGASKPSPFAPPSRKRDRALHPAKMTYTQPRNPLVTPLAYRPQVAVVAEPVQKRGVLGRIPLLGRLRKTPDGFVPPRPLHEVRPLVGGLEASELTRPLPVDVKVYVTETGKVKSADLLSSVDVQHEFLASAALVAARRWNFTPARADGERVPAEVILHFRFEPTRD
jgi:TonB family protein